MSTTLTLQIPDSIHKQLKAYAEQDGISLDQFVSTAVAEKLASLATLDYLEQRAQRSSKEKCKAAIAKVPDAEPEADDKLLAIPDRRCRYLESTSRSVFE